MRMNDSISSSARQIGMLAGISLSVIALVSCGSTDSNIPIVTGPGGTTATGTSSAASNLLAQGRAYQNAGRTRKALSAYETINKKYPHSTSSGEASFAKAQIFDKRGDIFDAFEAYQVIVAKHQDSPHYGAAVKRQEEIAHASADGVITNNFLGLKTKINPDKIQNMLGKVRDNAPQAPSAAKAQYTVGRMWQQQGSAAKATDAYKKVDLNYGSTSYAPEALYQTGEILILKAKHGNQNKANVNLARNVYEELIQRFPSHKRAADARKRLGMLGGQDIQRSYDVAEFYRAKGQNQAAIFYYQEVLRKSKSGALHNKAKQRMSELGAQ